MATLSAPSSSSIRCASCSAVPASPVNASLARCSRCKCVAYCSKPCQAAHWRAGHRNACPVLQLSERFRALETVWWRSRPPHELQALVAQHGLEPESMRFFGEVLFLLRGLKPMVMFSNVPTTWRSSFVRDVIAPSGVLQPSIAVNNSRRCAPGLFAVGDRVETPAGYDLSGDLVLVNERLSDALAVATASLRLTRLPVSVPLAPVKAMRAATEAVAPTDTSAAASPSDSKVHIVLDGVLAQLLDYPVALSECHASMVEIGYVLLRLSSATSTASSAIRSAVSAHFERYRRDLADASGDAMRLQLVETRV